MDWRINMKPTIEIFDVTSGEDIRREMNDAEFEQHQKDIENRQLRAEEFAKAQAEIEAKRLAALNKLEALGLEIDDLKALGLA